MTDPTPSPDALDELVSAVLDGEADAAERARVESDPALRARLAELRAVRDKVAAEVAPLDTVTATRLRHAALDATSDARPARGTRSPRVGRWLASVAAVVLLIAIAIPVLGSLGGESNYDSADSGGDSASESTVDESLSGAAAVQESADDGEADMSSEESRSEADSPVPLGSFVSDLALAREAISARASGYDETAPDEDALEQPNAVPGSSDSAGTSANDLSACPYGGGGTVVGVFVGRVGGDLRIVRVVESSDGLRSAEVIDPDTCKVVAAAP